MPFAGFDNFQSCLIDEGMVKQYPDEETRRKVCGALQAKAEKEHSSNNDNPMRELRAKISFDKYQEVDGGLLVKDVKLLASGTWTDSSIGTPLFYPEKVLEKFAGNWIDNSLWSRHGGASRSITDKIGEVRNPRYNDGAIIGDLWLHEKTQASRDTAELIKAGLVNYVSVEHGGKERWNAGEKRYDAEELILGGVAVVNRGACKVCTINNEEKSHSWQEPSKEIELGDEYIMETKGAADTVIAAEKDAELRALQAQASGARKSDIVALEAQLEEAKNSTARNLAAELFGANQKIAELEQANKETLRKLAEMEHGGRVKELQMEIAKLHAEPVYHTKIASGAVAAVRELELDNDDFPAFTAKDFGE